MEYYREYIALDSQKRFGKPCVKGTRISVYEVLNWLACGMIKADIKDDYPELNDNNINACLFFAADRTQFHTVVEMERIFNH
jgi:uncharacterized protein (DUF433 family)